MTLALINILVFIALVLVLGVGAAIILGRSSRRARLGQRLGVASDTARKTWKGQVDEGESSLRGRFGRAMQALGQFLPLFDARQRREMSLKLSSAGYRGPAALPFLMGLSVFSALLSLFFLLTFVSPMLAGSSALFRVGAMAAAAYIGLLLPRLVLDRLVIRRQRAIQRGFPDALDLLVVCTNAGLGLNAALQRVASELRVLAPELSDELTLTSQQLQISGDTNAVLQQMAERINLLAVRSLVATLVQSRQFGTPIGHALRVLSQSERTARLMRTEEAAAKLATKITLPMMIFILPTVLIIGAGPAFIQLMQTLSSQ